MHQLMRILIIIVCFIWITPDWAMCSTNQEIVIGITPERNIFEQHKRYKALVDYLSSETGINIKINTFRGYANIFDSFKSKKIDGAFLGSLNGVLAHEKLGAKGLA